MYLLFTYFYKTQYRGTAWEKGCGAECGREISMIRKMRMVLTELLLSEFDVYMKICYLKEFQSKAEHY